MNKFTPLALLVTGGFAAQAGAAVQTFNLSPTNPPTDIFIGGSTVAQYSYGSNTILDFTTDVKMNSRQSTSYFADATSGSDFPNASSDYTDAPFKPSSTGQSFVGLKFALNGEYQYGVATFQGLPTDSFSSFAAVDGPTLTQIEYQPSGVAVVPEPEQWALMIGGLGIAGAAARRRRTRTAVTA